MLAAAEVHRQLERAAAAAFDRDPTGLTAAQEWLEGLSGRDLLRVDVLARQSRYDGHTLGRSSQWSRSVLNDSATPAAIASMHRDGHVRERAVHRLAGSDAPLGDCFLALRVGDHVRAVRELATSTLLGRTNAEQAVRAMSVLHRFEQRDRGTEGAAAYLDRLAFRHGLDQTFGILRASTDRDLRRYAFRRSLESSLIGLREAEDLLPRERDQMVRRWLAHMVAEQGDAAVIRELLLHGRSADSRALALVRLQAPELTAVDLLPLLVDSSVLVRFWARKRWQELGMDAGQACRDLIASATSPARQARAYVSFLESGGELDRAEVLRLVRSPAPALQRVGLRLLVAAAMPEDVPELLELVGTARNRAARLAVDVLDAHLGLWTLDDLSVLKASLEPEIRRRAWALHRTRGGWESLIADLELAVDPDPLLARLGRDPKPPMYLLPSEEQRVRLNRLLTDALLSRDRRLAIAFAAGLDGLVAELRSQTSWM